MGLSQEELDQVIKKETLEKMQTNGTSDDRNNQLLILMALGLVTDLVEVYKVGAINLRVDMGLVYHEFSIARKIIDPEIRGFLNLALQAMIVINRVDLVKLVLDYARMNTFLVYVKPDDLFWALR